MKIAELRNCPQWLKDAKTNNAEVHLMLDGRISWDSGAFLGGAFLGGEFRGGEFRGEFRGGAFLGGAFLGGEFWGGEFRGGAWISGVWMNGEWKLPENRMSFMLAMVGVVGDGLCVAYRTTKADGRGRHNSEFLQPEGEYYESDLPAAGSGTCVKGIHVTTAARAWTYFGIDPTCQMWRVRFKREDVLDCDSEKIRIRGGFFEKIDRPF